MLQRWLVLWLSLVSLVAYFWPRIVGSESVLDPFRGSGAILPAIIAAIMFAIGWLLPRDELAQVLRRWPDVIWGTATQYISMPLLAYGVAKLYGFEGSIKAGVIIVGCVPGAMASNVVTLVARGNVSYSVSLTTSATLLSPIVVPFAMWLFLGSEDIPYDPWQVSLQLLVGVVAPVVVGHLLARWLAKLRAASGSLAENVATVLLIWLIAIVVGNNRARLAEIEVALLSALLLVNLGGYLAGYFAGYGLRFPEAMRRALAIEVGMQNAGLGVVLATRLFSPEAAIPPALFAFGCMFTGGVLARIWAGFPPEPAAELGVAEQPA